MKIKNLICGALVATSLFCGVGCTPRQSSIEKEYEIKSVVLQETSSKSMENAINDWLLQNPNIEIMFIDYEKNDENNHWDEDVVIIYRIIKENEKNVN